MRVCLDRYAGRYKELRSAATSGDYLATRGDRADEELLTEPLLGEIVEKVLGLLDEGRRLVERIERLVALYEVPAELTADVVEHAGLRAAAP